MDNRSVLVKLFQSTKGSGYYWHTEYTETTRPICRRNIQALLLFSRMPLTDMDIRDAETLARCRTTCFRLLSFRCAVPPGAAWPAPPCGRCTATACWTCCRSDCSTCTWHTHIRHVTLDTQYCCVHPLTPPPGRVVTVYLLQQRNDRASNPGSATCLCYRINLLGEHGTIRPIYVESVVKR